jgi:hypothetical protein
LRRGEGGGESGGVVRKRGRVGEGVARRDEEGARGRGGRQRERETERQGEKELVL